MAYRTRFIDMMRNIQLQSTHWNDAAPLIIDFSCKISACSKKQIPSQQRRYVPLRVAPSWAHFVGYFLSPVAVCTTIKESQKHWNKFSQGSSWLFVFSCVALSNYSQAGLCRGSLSGSTIRGSSSNLLNDRVITCEKRVGLGIRSGVLVLYVV